MRRKLMEAFSENAKLVLRLLRVTYACKLIIDDHGQLFVGANCHFAFPIT